MGELVPFPKRHTQPAPADNGLELLPTVHLAVIGFKRLTEVAQANGIVRTRVLSGLRAEDRERFLAVTPVHSMAVLMQGITNRLDSGSKLSDYARLAPGDLHTQLQARRRVATLDEALAERLHEAALREGDVAVTALINFIALSSQPTQLSGEFASLVQENARPALHLVLPPEETDE